MALSERSFESVTQLRDRVRFECNDPSQRKSGQLIPEAQRRFSDSEILRAIQDSITQLSEEKSRRDIHFGLRNVEVSVTSSVVSIPSDISGEAILSIEDIRSPSVPFNIKLADPRERINYAETFTANALAAVIERSDPEGASSGEPAWQLRFSPESINATTIRIWYISAPVVPNVDGDAHTLTKIWAELIALMSARSLLARTDGFADQQSLRLLTLAANYRKSYTNRQPGRVRRARRGIM